MFASSTRRSSGWLRNRVSPVALTIVRAVLFPLFALSILLVYGRAVGWLGASMPYPVSRTLLFMSLMASGFLSASAVAVVFAYPLAWVYRHNAFIAALFATLPVLYIRLPEL